MDNTDADYTPTVAEICAASHDKTGDCAPGGLPIDQNHDVLLFHHFTATYSIIGFCIGMIVACIVLWNVVDRPARRYGGVGAAGGLLFGTVAAPLFGVICAVIWPLVVVYTVAKLVSPSLKVKAVERVPGGCGERRGSRF